MDSVTKEILPPPPSQENNTNETNSKPSRLTTGEYAVLMETNGKECESWLYFIRREGNDENLKYLQKQIQKILLKLVKKFLSYFNTLLNNI